MLSLSTNESIETVQTHLSKWPYNVHVTMIHIAGVMRITRKFISGGEGGGVLIWLILMLIPDTILIAFTLEMDNMDYGYRLITVYLVLSINA